MNGFLPADWPAPPGVFAGTTLRDGPGVSAPPFDRFNLGERCGDEPIAVAANRAALRGMLDMPGEPRWLRQVHGRGVVRVETRPTATTTHTAPEADAAVSDASGVVLAVLHADCLPLLLAAVDGSEIGAAHAGWRGLAGGVIEATVAAMSTPASRLRAWLGPAAGPMAYEVGDDVRAAFVAADPAAADAFRATRPGHWLCNLYALARQRLRRIGVDDIHGGGLCTITDRKRFYSHRRDARTGRMASLVWRTA